MRKELVVFLVTLAVLAALWFLSGPPGTPAATRGGGRGAPRAVDPQAAVAAKSTPGRFIPEPEVTWAATASNIFETPTETRDLPPLDLAPPPVPRLPHPGPPLTVPIGLKARGGLRRPIVPVAGAPPPQDASNGGGGTPPGTGTTTNPTPPGPGGGEPLIPLGKDLGAIDRIKLSIEAELNREKEKKLAQESEEERKRRLDKLTTTSGDVFYGEMVATERNENRYATKRELDRLRTDPSLTEPERNEKLKKFKPIGFRTDRKGKLLKANHYPADSVAQVTFADTPENRYRQRLLEVPPKDLAQQLELAKILFDARLFKLAAQHLAEMRKNALSSPEMLTMLADSQHEIFEYNEELEVLRAAVKEFPDSVPLLGRLGRLQLKLGMPGDARASFEKVLAKNASDPLANAGMGDVLMRTGDPKTAIGHLKEALNLAGPDPLKVDAVRLNLGEAYLRLGEFKNAHDIVDLVLQRTGAAGPERAPISERAAVLSAIAALGQGQLVEARTRAEEGAKQHPLSGQLSYLLGIIMAQQGELEPARSRLTAAIELDPLLTGHAQVALAIIEESTAHDDAAVGTAETGALTGNPGALELRLPFGRALLNVADLGRAREQFLTALDYEPRSADALAALGDVHYAEGALPEAIRFYDRAAALEPAFPQLLPRRIITQVRRRKLAEADELAAMVTTADLKDPFVQAALAYFQYTKGNQAESLGVLERLAQADAGVLSKYAKDAHDAINAHQNKALWVDTFSRTGAQIGREWKRELGSGIVMALQNNAVGFEGTQKLESDKPTILWQERPGDRMYGFSVDLDLPVQPGVYAGVGIMVFNQGVRATAKWPGIPDSKERGGAVAYTGMQVALSPDAKLVYRVLVKGAMSEWLPVPVTTYAGGPVTIELRLTDPREGIVEVLVNRDSVLRQTIADLKRFRRGVELQIFCQAQIDRKVHFTADNVTIVTLKDPK